MKWESEIPQLLGPTRRPSLLEAHSCESFSPGPFGPDHAYNPKEPKMTTQEHYESLCLLQCLLSRTRSCHLGTVPLTTLQHSLQLSPWHLSPTPWLPLIWLVCLSLPGSTGQGLHLPAPPWTPNPSSWLGRFRPTGADWATIQGDTHN